MRPTTVVRRRLAATGTAILSFGVLVIAGSERAGAAPPAPVVLNSGSQNSGDTQRMETQQLADDGELERLGSRGGDSEGNILGVTQEVAR